MSERDPLLARAEALQESELFDAAFYRSQNPDVAAYEPGPLLHYLQYGGAEGRSPHRLFDGRFYLARHPECAADGSTPLEHWLREGLAEDFDPHPLFDVSFYREQLPDLVENPILHYLREGEAAGASPHPLFDVAYYRGRYADVVLHQAGALDHYLRWGGAEGRSPHRLFDGLFYLARHTACTTDGRTPLEHWLLHGLAEDFDPHPLFDVSFYREQLPDLVENPVLHYLREGDAKGASPHPLFDVAYYRGRYADVVLHEAGALDHYLRFGGAEGRSPHRLFDGRFYLAAHPECTADGRTPLEHWLLHGLAEDFDPHPLFDVSFYRESFPDLVENPILHYLREGEASGASPHPLFDVGFYRARYPDVALHDAGALDHYLRWGGVEGRSTHWLFDGRFYLAQHPECTADGTTPLAHWLCEGLAADADPHPLFDVSFYRASQRDPDENPVVDYLRAGEPRGLDPHPLFQVAYYLTRYPDVADYEAGPLQHFLHWGGAEGRSPHPLFDARFYLTQQPACSERRENALLHYLREGEAAGADPHPLFDSDWYARQRDLGELGPLLHWVTVGAQSGADPHPLFDVRWYRGYHVDGVPDDADPLAHYVEIGAAAGMRPNPFFDPTWYGARYGVRLRPRETALEHFVREGAPRGHRPGPLFDACFRFFRDRDPAYRARGLHPLSGWFEPAYDRLASGDAELPIVLPACDDPEVSIVIPVYGAIGYALACLRSIAAAETRVSYEVIAVDDRPALDPDDVLARVPNLRRLRNESNRGFVDSCNRGAEAARGRDLVFLNDDAIATDGWLDELVETRRREPRCGAVGAKLVFPTGVLQEAGGIVWNDGSARHYGSGEDPETPAYDHARRVDYASAAALLVPRAIFLGVGGFDRDFAPAFYEDTDLAFRLRAAGHEVFYQPTAQVIHFGGASYGRDPRRGAKRHQVLHQARFAERWAKELEAHQPPGSDPDRAARRLARGRALVVDCTMLTPDQDSGSLRMFNLLRILLGLGWDVTFVPADWSRSDIYGRMLRRVGAQVAGPPLVASFERLLEEQGALVDLAIVSRPDVAVRWLDTVRKLCPRAALLYDTVDIHFLRREREIAVRGSSGMGAAQKEEEMRAARRADAVLVVSDFDRDVLLREDPSLRVHVLSNIHEIEPTTTPFSERSGIVFIGGFRHPPNADAVAWFVAEILPLVHAELPDVVFDVVGSDAPPEVRALSNDRIRVHGYVRDPREIFARARLSVAPLRYGAGVKGKVNQSMSLGVPVVATSIAAEGMEVEPGVDIVVADDAAAFAREVIALYRDAARWNEIARAGIRNVERVFSMDVAREKLVAILRAQGRSA